MGIVLIADIGNIPKEIVMIGLTALITVNIIGHLKGKDVLATREDRESGGACQNK